MFNDTGTPIDQADSMTVFWVYLISDPESGGPRYVGLTTDPSIREMRHRSCPRDAGNKFLAAWFTQLRKKHLKPEFSILACVSGDNEEVVTVSAKHVERHWIRTLAHEAKGDLLNIDWNGWRKALLTTPVSADLENHIV